MFAPSSLDQQLAATWNAAREPTGAGPAVTRLGGVAFVRTSR